MERFQKINPTAEQRAYVRKNLTSKYRQGTATRKTSEEERFYGFLGEVIVADAFEQQRPTFYKADDGYDVTYNGAKIDVKVNSMNATPKEDYHVSFYSKQEKNCSADYLLYLLYNKQKEVFYVAGIMSLKGFLNFAKLHEKGQDVLTPEGKLIYTIESDAQEQYITRISNLAVCELTPHVRGV